MKNDFLAFMTSREAPPHELEALTRKDIILSFRGRDLVLKFILFQIIGALFSLSVCPQFGLGLGEGHGITHVFRQMGDWVCALFCGSVFLSSGLLVAFIGMPGEELWWVWRRQGQLLLFFPALLWGALMLTGLGLNLPGETMTYHLAWIAAAILMQTTLLQLRRRLYEEHLLSL